MATSFECAARPVYHFRYTPAAPVFCAPLMSPRRHADMSSYASPPPRLPAVHTRPPMIRVNERRQRSSVGEHHARCVAKPCRASPQEMARMRGRAVPRACRRACCLRAAAVAQHRPGGGMVSVRRGRCFITAEPRCGAVGSVVPFSRRPANRHAYARSSLDILVSR